MADAKPSAPAPAAPLRAPRSGQAARAAAPRRGLLWLVADALLLVWLGAVSARFASNATAIAARWAFGPCSLAAVVAVKASDAAFPIVRVLSPIALPLFWRAADWDRPQAEGGAPRPSAMEVMVLGSCTLVMLLGLLIQMLAATNCSCCLAMLGSGLTDVANIVAFPMLCFGFFPGFFRHLVGLWRAELSKFWNM